MDEDGLPIVGTGIDYTKVKALDQKRLLAFINHFVSHTVQFLNHFSGVCEAKMTKVENQLHRMEITMSIIEAKLSSIPGMDDITLAEKSSAATEQSATPSQSSATPQAPAPSGIPAPPGAPAVEQPAPVEAAPPAPAVDVPTVSKDPRFIKFFKMLNMGVPPPAVKIKMTSEGVDPGLLDTPDAPAPPADLIEDGDSSDSEDAFTDSD